MQGYTELLRTDVTGRYRYETIRPHGYGDSRAHLHHVVSARGYKTRLRDYWIADDPLTVARCKPGGAQAGFCGLVGPVTRDSDGVWHVTFNFDMVPE